MCVTMHMASFQLAMEPCMCMLGQACHAKRDDDPDLRVCREWVVLFVVQYCFLVCCVCPASDHEGKRFFKSVVVV